MIDAHCHLNFQKFAKDYEHVLLAAKQAGVSKIINVGTSIASSEQAVLLSEKYPELYAVVGVHPHHADKIETPSLSKGAGGISWLEQLETMTTHPKVVGIGEIGIDYFSYEQNGIVDPKKQEAVFIAQLELAHTAKLPIQIHTRTEKARRETIRIVKEHKHLLQSIPGMFHCFAGSRESLDEVLSLGFSVGFDGNTLYHGIPKGEPLSLPDLVKETPMNRIVIETDSPYLSPPPHRGERNTPAYGIITARFIAELKGVSFETLVEQTDKNVYTIFGKMQKA